MEHRSRGVIRRVSTLLAGAVALLVTSLAGAQGSFVQIYGSLNAGLEYAKRDDATASTIALNSLTPAPGLSPLNTPGQARLVSSNSNIGFRGTEDLGGGLKAIFQLESFIFLDTGGGNLGGRNSNVGLQSDWGVVFYGIWDTPYKLTTVRLDAFNVWDANYESILGSPGFNVVAGTFSGRQNGPADASFERRQGNSVHYWTPQWKGLSAKVAFSPGEQKGTVGGVSINPWIWSAAVAYENGPFYLTYGYEQHNDFFGLNGMLAASVVTPIGTANSGSRDFGHRAGAGYTFFGNTTVGVIYEYLSYQNDLAAGSALTATRKYSRDAYYVTLQQRLGNFVLRGQVGWASDGSCSLAALGCSNADLASTNWAVGASYDLSKRTELYLYYARVSNERGSNYNFDAGGSITGGPGSDPQTVALAIRHRF